MTSDRHARKSLDHVPDPSLNSLQRFQHDSSGVWRVDSATVFLCFTFLGGRRVFSTVKGEVDVRNRMLGLRMITYGPAWIRESS